MSPYQYQFTRLSARLPGEPLSSIVVLFTLFSISQALLPTQPPPKKRRRKSSSSKGSTTPRKIAAPAIAAVPEIAVAVAPAAPATPASKPRQDKDQDQSKDPEKIASSRESPPVIIAIADKTSSPTERSPDIRTTLETTPETTLAAVGTGKTVATASGETAVDTESSPIIIVVAGKTLSPTETSPNVGTALGTALAAVETGDTVAIGPEKNTAGRKPPPIVATAGESLSPTERSPNVVTALGLALAAVETGSTVAIGSEEIAASREPPPIVAIADKDLGATEESPNAGTACETALRTALAAVEIEKAATIGSRERLEAVPAAEEVCRSSPLETTAVTTIATATNLTAAPIPAASSVPVAAVLTRAPVAGNAAPVQCPLPEVAQRAPEGTSAILPGKVTEAAQAAAPSAAQVNAQASAQILLLSAPAAPQSFAQESARATAPISTPTHVQAATPKPPKIMEVSQPGSVDLPEISSARYLAAATTITAPKTKLPTPTKPVTVPTISEPTTSSTVAPAPESIAQTSPTRVAKLEIAEPAASQTSTLAPNILGISSKLPTLAPALTQARASSPRKLGSAMVEEVLQPSVRKLPVAAACLPVRTESVCSWPRPFMMQEANKSANATVTTKEPADAVSPIDFQALPLSSPRVGSDYSPKSKPVLSAIDLVKVAALPQSKPATFRQQQHPISYKKEFKASSYSSAFSRAAALTAVAPRCVGEAGMSLLAAVAVGRALEEAQQQAQQQQHSQQQVKYWGLPSSSLDDVTSTPGGNFFARLGCAGPLSGSSRFDALRHPDAARSSASLVNGK